MFVTEPIVDFCRFWGYWPSNNPSLDHDVKGKIVSLVKRIVFGTNGKRILCWSMFAIEPIAHFSLLPDNWLEKNGSIDHNVKGEFASLEKHIVFGATGKKNFM